MYEKVGAAGMTCALFDVATLPADIQLPQTQGMIERYHRTIKNVVKLDNYYSPEELERTLEMFVQTYNHERYHEALDNLTQADMYYGRGELILMQRERIKQNCFSERKNNYENLKVKKNLINLVIN